MIQNEKVKVNGTVATQRGKKLTGGDAIEMNGKQYKVEQE